MAEIELDPDTIKLLGLDSAAAAEGTDPPHLLPPTPVDAVLGERSGPLAKLMAAELRGGFQIASPEVLLVSKPTRGRRPVSILTPRERILYRALAEALGDDVPPPDRGSGAFEVFNAAPLNESMDGYVVMADVSACYQYLDHRVLHQEIVSRTADSFLADAIVTFLEGIQGQTFGLPQNREASHRIAELVLGIPERVLIRRDFKISRYSDDFRIWVPTPTAAHEAIEYLDSALRSIGLTLNDEKTVIKSLSEYESWASAASRRVAEIQDETEFELSEFSYDGELIEPDHVEVLAESADRFLAVWKEDVALEQNRYGPAAVVGRQILAVALGVLAAVGDARALELCHQILLSEPSLTPNVARYLAAQLPDHEDEFDEAFDQIIDSPDLYLSPWQSVWLMEPLARSSALTRSQFGWLSDLLAGRSDYARASAACALAHHHSAPVDDVVASFEVASPASQPLLVSALAIQGDSNSKRVSAVASGDRLFRWILASFRSE